MLIVVVDDNPDVRTLVALVLQGEGFTVIQAANGEEALRMTSKLGNLDLLLTDVEMGDGLNGFELREKILEDRPNLPVLIMSGIQEYEKVAAFRQVEFIAKPFSIGILKERVRTLLELESEMASTGTIKANSRIFESQPVAV